MRPGGSGTSRSSDSAVMLLPQPELADDCQRLMRLKRKADAIDGFDEAVP